MIPPSTNDSSDRTRAARTPLWLDDIATSRMLFAVFLTPNHTFNPCGTIGSDRSRTPTASKIALPIAGAIATIGVSPAPAEGRSLRSSRTTSILGMSRNRGTRYFENSRVHDLAILELDRLEERTAQAHHHRPFDLVLEMVRVDDRAALEGADSSDTTCTRPLDRRRPPRRRWRRSSLFRTRPRCRSHDRPRSLLPQPNAPAAASRTARSRASLRFFSRNSSGSIFTAWASSSMCDSRAKWLAVEASAR